jgi:hypothetical protein
MAELPVVRRAKSIEDVKKFDRGLSSRDHDGFLFHEMKYLRKKYKGIMIGELGSVIGVRGISEPCADKVSHYNYNISIVCSELTKVSIEVRGEHDMTQRKLLGVDQQMSSFYLHEGLNMIFGHAETHVMAQVWDEENPENFRYFKTYTLYPVDDKVIWTIKDLTPPDPRCSVQGINWRWFNGFNFGDRERIDAIGGVVLSHRRNNPQSLVALARLQLLKNDIEMDIDGYAYGLPVDNSVPEHSVIKLKTKWYEFYSRKLYKLDWRQYLGSMEQQGEEIYVSDDVDDEWVL